MSGVRFAHRIAHRLGIPERRRRQMVDGFHRLYYASGRQTWKNTRWLGARALKTPLDLWIYQELLVALLPALIIETGTAEGGSALFLASICELLGRGEVVTIDTEAREQPHHPRITYLTGSSTAPETLAAVAERAQGKSPVMVLLDSEHKRDHVLAELRSYADFVTPGSYLVVEDTNLNDHPVLPGFGPGPMEAVEEFLQERDDFESDPSSEKFLLTFNPRGYLRRKS